MSKPAAAMSQLRWHDLTASTRELLQGKLAGLWGATSDAESFDSWPIDKQRAMLMLLDRMDAKGLWHVVKRVTNIYGEGGVGMQFEAWPMVESKLIRRSEEHTSELQSPCKLVCRLLLEKTKTTT